MISTVTILEDSHKKKEFKCGENVVVKAIAVYGGDKSVIRGQLKDGSWISEKHIIFSWELISLSLAVKLYFNQTKKCALM